MKDISIKHKIWIETEDKSASLGDGRCNLLKTIAETGSLKAAMEIHGLTYRKTWDRLNKMEEMFGFQIIHRQRGGVDGGKTELTPQGQAIVSAFSHFHDKYDPIISQGLEETLEEIKKNTH